MKEKSAEQMARDTLNALIASGQIPSKVLYTQGERTLLDKDLLREIEAQLRDYYSTGPYQPPAPYSLGNVR